MDSHQHTWDAYEVLMEDALLRCPAITNKHPFIFHQKNKTKKNARLVPKNQNK